MNTQYNTVAILEMLAAVLDLICINIRCRHLNRRRKVHNHRIFLRRLPHLLHRRTDLYCIIHLRSREALRGIFQNDLSGEICCQLFHPLRSLNGNLLDFFAVLIEHDVSLQCRGRVVNMNNGLLAALNALEGALNLLLAALGKHLNANIIRDPVFFNQLTDKIKFNLTRRRESNLNLLEAKLHEKIPHLKLL